MVKILAFAGSSRTDSWNKKLVAIAAEGARDAGADVTLIDLRDFPMPIYDGDLEAEHGLPEHARRFKQLLIENDGLLISSPEYNSGYSALLKNCIDWASRSGEPGEKPLVAYRGKYASLMSASPGRLGGLRGLVSVRMLLGNLGMVVLPDQVAVSGAAGAFGDDGRLLDEKQQQSIVGLGGGPGTDPDEDFLTLKPDRYRIGEGVAGGGFESTRDPGSAVDAASIPVQVPVQYPVPVPGDHRAAALGAVSAAAAAVMYVAHIDIAQALIQGDFSGFHQGPVGSVPDIRHLPVGVKSREVEGYVGSQVFTDPSRHVPDFIRIVVFTRYQQGGDFQPAVGLVLDVFKVVEYRLEAPAADTIVKFFGKRLEVHVYRIHVAEERLPCLFGDIGRSHGHGLDVVLAAGQSDIQGIFVENHRIVVGEGHAPATVIPRCRCDALG